MVFLFGEVVYLSTGFTFYFFHRHILNSFEFFVPQSFFLVFKKCKNHTPS